MQQASSKLRRFKDLDFYQFQEHQGVEKQVHKPEHLGLPLGKSERGIETTPYSNPEDNHGEISFEANFLDEHEWAFKKQSENFIELTLKEKEYAALGFNAIKNMDYAHFQPKRLTWEQEKLFQAQLKNEEKLNDLVKMMTGDTDQEVAAQLKYLAYQAWRSYQSFKNPFLTESQLIENSQKITQQNYLRLFKESGIKFLNLEVVQKTQLVPQCELIEAFKSFVGFFYTTIFYVAEGYFENPYHEDPQKAKRGRRDSEQFSLQKSGSSSDDFNFYPHKKFS